MLHRMSVWLARKTGAADAADVKSAYVESQSCAARFSADVLYERQLSLEFVTGLSLRPRFMHPVGQQTVGVSWQWARRRGMPAR
jgi:hypothetical protein